MIRNVFVFVADALREDYLSPRISEKGDVINGISASTITPTSFASIITGLLPPQHGIRSFGQSVPDKHNWLFNNKEIETSFYDEMGKRGEDGVYAVLNATTESRTRRLSDLSPPFVHIERAHETHAPYELPNNGEYDRTASEYWEEHSNSGIIKDQEKIQEEYSEMVQAQTDRFFERLDGLKEQGLLEETLVLFTSDHGELLGRRNPLLKSHTLPLLPELVRVPMVSIHPDNKEPSTSLVSHVDILPTIADELNLSLPKICPGQSIFSSGSRTYCYSDFAKLQGFTPIQADEESSKSFVTKSVWDADGGWVFNEDDLLDLLHSYLHYGGVSKGFFLSDGPVRHPSLFFKTIKLFLQSETKYGDSPISEDEARKYIKSIESLPKLREQGLIEEVNEKRLRSLGYK